MQQPSTSPTTRRRRRMASLGAVLASAALALSACTTASGPTASEATGAGTVPNGLERFYEQQPSWSDCGDTECATIDVPLDYSQPTGSTIEIALARTKGAKGESSLVLNPGGPGGSGVNMVKQSATMLISDKVRAQYTIVGFDPRGVGASTAVRCVSDEQTDEQRESTTVPTDKAEIQKMLLSSKEYADACQKNSPEGLLEHVDTTSSARDLDVIRAVLGSQKLDYLGYSYGTKLGAVYLSLFPANAGRMVLDGAIDPKLDGPEVALGQAKAFESSLDHYLASCLKESGCPFTGTPAEARKQLTDWVRSTDKEPLQTSSGRSMPAPEVVSAILLPMYEPMLDSMLTSALGDAINNGDGSQLLYLADLSQERDADGSYATNMNAAFTAINCVDYSRGSSDPATIEAEGKAMEKAAPFFGRYMGYDDGCSQWPAPVVDADRSLAFPKDLAPVLVVGTTGDPATPYAWAEELHQELPNSGLLSYEGWGHTAYGRSNACVASAVDDYLLKGTVPSAGTTC